MYILICTQRPGFYVYTTIYTIKIWIKEIGKIALPMRFRCGRRLRAASAGRWCYDGWVAGWNGVYIKKCVYLEILRIQKQRQTQKRWQQPRDSRGIEYMRPENAGGVSLLLPAALQILLCAQKTLRKALKICAHDSSIEPRIAAAQTKCDKYTICGVSLMLPASCCLLTD